jgi:hypothetical protein
MLNVGPPANEFAAGAAIVSAETSQPADTGATEKETYAYIPRRDASFVIEQYCRGRVQNSQSGLVNDKNSAHRSKRTVTDQERAHNESEGKKDGEENEEDDEDGEDGMCEEMDRKDNSNALAAVNPDLVSHPVSMPEPLQLWFPTVLHAAEICRRRQHIKECALSGRPLEDFVLETASLQALVCEYDRLFFGGRLFSAMGYQKTALTVVVGGHVFKKGDGGLCSCKGDSCSIHLHPGLAELTFGRGHVEEVNGLTARCVLDCVQLILEHELVHALVLVFDRQFKDCHGKRFQELAKGLFGHLLFTHSIGVQTRPLEELVQEIRHANLKRPHFKTGTVVLYREDNHPHKDSHSINRPTVAPHTQGRVGITKDSQPKGCKGTIEPELVPPSSTGERNVLGAQVALAAIIGTRKDSITVMHSDGRIVEKLPYTRAQLYRNLTISNREKMSDPQAVLPGGDHKETETGLSEENVFRDAETGCDLQELVTANRLPIELHSLRSHCLLFMENKKQVERGETVQFADANGNRRSAQVLMRKPLGVVIRTNKNTTTLLPFHTVRRLDGARLKKTKPSNHTAKKTSSPQK